MMSTRKQGDAMGADAKTAMKGVDLSDAAARRIAKIVSGEPGKIGREVAQVDRFGHGGFLEELRDYRRQTRPCQR